MIVCVCALEHACVCGRDTGKRNLIILLLSLLVSIECVL